VALADWLRERSALNCAVVMEYVSHAWETCAASLEERSGVAIVVWRRSIGVIWMGDGYLQVPGMLICFCLNGEKSQKSQKSAISV